MGESPAVSVRDLVEVAPGVLVATSRWYATTSTILLDGRGGAIVVDPAYLADELAGFAPALDGLSVTAVAGVATHIHYDHVLWHPTLGTPPRWTSPWTATTAQENRTEVLAPLVADLPADLIDVAGHLEPLTVRLKSAETQAIPPTYVVPWDGPTILAHEHHAHAPHHLALEISDAGVLLSGDMLSDVELPMPDDDDEDLSDYLDGLDRLAPIVARCHLLVPGHGTPTYDPMARLDADRRYLDDLLTRGASDDPRLGLPDMDELHNANLARAQRRRAR